MLLANTPAACSPWVLTVLLLALNAPPDSARSPWEPMPWVEMLLSLRSSAAVSLLYWRLTMAPLA